MFLMFRPYAHFFDLHGRSRRLECWIWILVINIIVTLVVTAALLTLPHADKTQLQLLGDIGLGVLGITNIIPFVTMQVRRFHDLGTTGWWTILTLIPMFGLFVAIVSWLIPGQTGENRYGPNPRVRQVVTDTAEPALSVPDGGQRGLTLVISLAVALIVVGTVRWSRSFGQFGGLAKVGSGLSHAANLMSC